MNKDMKNYINKFNKEKHNINKKSNNYTFLTSKVNGRAASEAIDSHNPNSFHSKRVVDDAIDSYTHSRNTDEKKVVDEAIDSNRENAKSFVGALDSNDPKRLFNDTLNSHKPKVSQQLDNMSTHDLDDYSKAKKSNDVLSQVKSFHKLYNMGAVNTKFSFDDIENMDKEQNGKELFSKLGPTGIFHKSINPNNASHYMKIGRQRQNKISSKGMEVRLSKLNLDSKLNHANHVSDIQSNKIHSHSIKMNNKNNHLANKVIRKARQNRSQDIQMPF